MYVFVYAPSGEMFEVSRDKADVLILQKGWTQSAPVSAEKSSPAPRKVYRSFRKEEEKPEASSVELS